MEIVIKDNGRIIKLMEKARITILMETYAGEWEDGLKEGEGTFLKINGDKYVGSWSKNKKDGKRYVYIKSGDIYVGLWVNDQRSGSDTNLCKCSEYVVNGKMII